MRLRSLLFVPGDRPDRMDKALGSGADALILDLEDSVRRRRKSRSAQGRGGIPGQDRVPCRCLCGSIGCSAPTRISRAVIPAKAGRHRAAQGGRRGVHCRIGPAPFRAGRRATRPSCPSPPKRRPRFSRWGLMAASRTRLCGLSWGVEDLSAAIGATTAREAEGRYTPPFEMVRALALFAAHAAGVAAIETIYPALHDEEGLKAYAARGRRDGFSGMLAVHPAQIAVINGAFTPSHSGNRLGPARGWRFCRKSRYRRAADGRTDAGCAASGTGEKHPEHRENEP